MNRDGHRDGIDGGQDGGIGGGPDDALLAAWALDAVDDQERRDLERRLEADPELRARADALSGTVARLAASTPARPPAGLRDRVLSAAAGTEQDPGPERSRPADLDRHRARRRPDRRRWWVTVASAAAAAAVAVGLLVTQPWVEAPGISEGEQLTALEQVLQVDGAQRLESAVTGGGAAEAAMAPNGEAVLAVRDLPDPADGHDYQLWTIQGEQPPQPAGLLQVQGGRALVRMQQVPAGAAMAVTVEPDGGSEAPTTEPIVVLAAG
ncbi:anti-sigma factor domain-containing protein [Microbacterium sp. A93]|uniref:anti-sigma factor n=1 Tax=Microbacterium sp. A93 TaxID=3450716 RepID=UPI003F428FEF